MSYREALKYFELNELYKEDELKSKYYLFAKKHHPDNNKDDDDSEMKKINAMYSILLNELKKRKLKEMSEDIRSNINKLKEKYKNTEIYELCLLYENKIKSITNIVDLEKIKNEFNQKIKDLKKKIIVPKTKELIIKDLTKYLTLYSDDVKSLVNTYIDAINISNSLEEINSIKQKYNQLLDIELLKEKDRIKELKVVKDGLKRSSIYYFYINAKNMDINNILTSHELLIDILKLINIINLENKDSLINLINNIDYSSLESSINLLELFYLKNTSNIKIKDFDITKLTKHEELKIDDNDHELIDLVLDKYYLYATKKKESIDKLINDSNYFKELFTIVKNINQDNKNKIINYLSSQSYKNLKVLLSSFDDFLDPSKLYIERTTGELCVIEKSNKKIYTIFLNGKVLNDLKTENDIIWKYMPLMKFFKVSEYSNGYEIEEVNDEEVISLSDYNTNYLYFTKELLLCLFDDGNDVYFKFISSIKDFDFIRGNNSQITRNSYFKYYKNKDKCLMDLLLYIKNIDNVKNNEKSL